MNWEFSHLPPLSLSLSLSLCFFVDPIEWNTGNVQKWLLWTEHLYRLPHAGKAFQDLTGKDLCAMSEEEFHQRSPQCGDTLHAHLDIWKSGVCLTSASEPPAAPTMSILTSDECFSTCLCVFMCNMSRSGWTSQVISLYSTYLTGVFQFVQHMTCSKLVFFFVCLFVEETTTQKQMNKIIVRERSLSLEFI